jgi:hypothetical protein
MNKKSDLGESVRNGWSYSVFKYKDAFSIIWEEYDILDSMWLKSQLCLENLGQKTYFYRNLKPT